MLTLHPKILSKDGKNVSAVLPYEEFEQITTALADYEDLKDLKTAKRTEGNVPGTPLPRVRQALDI